MILFSFFFFAKLHKNYFSFLLSFPLISGEFFWSPYSLGMLELLAIALLLGVWYSSTGWSYEGERRWTKKGLRVYHTRAPASVEERRKRRSYRYMVQSNAVEGLVHRSVKQDRRRAFDNDEIQRELDKVERINRLFDLDLLEVD